MQQITRRTVVFFAPGETGFRIFLLSRIIIIIIIEMSTVRGRPRNYTGILDASRK